MSATATRSIVVENRLPYPPAKVWRIMTEPALLGAWLMPNDIRAEVGHSFTFRTQPQPGFDGVVQCQVLAVEPLARIAYSWANGELHTTVTWTLADDGAGGTLLRLDHDGFPPEEERTRSMLEQGWGKMAAEGGSMRRVLDGLTD